MKILCQSYDKRHLNKYVFNIYPDSFDVKNLDIKNIFFSKSKIVHFHWPESFLNEKRFLIFYMKFLYTFMILFIIKLKKMKIIWTVHNLQPHDNNHSSLVTRSFYDFFIRKVDGFIFLSNTSKKKFEEKFILLKQNELAVIKHPLYSYNKEYDSNRVSLNPFESNKFFLMFGNFRPYKNLKEFLHLISDTKINIFFAGKFYEKTDLEFIKSISKKNRHIRFLNRSLEQEELNELIENSKGVLIPYKIPLNSGVIFHSISLRKRLLISNLNDTSHINANFKQFIYNIDLNSFKDYMKDILQNNHTPALNDATFQQYNYSIKQDHKIFFKTCLKKP